MCFSNFRSEFVLSCVSHLLVLFLFGQPRLSEAAANAVKDLLPPYAEDDLGSLCLWADRVKFVFPWSSALHYINTPDLCTYQYNSKLLCTGLL